jgi:hypothetical protein
MWGSDRRDHRWCWYRCAASQRLRLGKDLALLPAIRHAEPIKTAAEEFKRITAEKEALDKAKEQARDKLDKYSDEVNRIMPVAACQCRRKPRQRSGP